MRKKYYCISVVNITKAIAIALFVILPSLLIAQQSPSIQSGVTFQWSDTQSGLSDPATIESVTINGIMYNTFVVPSSYEMTRLGPDGHSPNRIKRNGSNVGGDSNFANWNSRAIDAFQDKNLNHYFNANPNGRNICLDFNAAATTDAQKQTIFYSPSIPSNEGGVLAVTERGANNCFYIEIWGTPVGGGPEQKLGQTFVRNVGDYRDNCSFGVPANGSDYWKSGRCNENGQTIGIGLFYLSDIAPLGSKITKIEFIAATRDHGDGKFFLLQKYAVDQQDTNCLNTPFNGNVHMANNVPNNSTYSITSPPSVAGQSFTFNSDGTFNYVPTPGFIGDVTFEYEVCLPSPNTNVCDQATVTLNYLPEPPAPEIDVSCDSTNNFVISVTSPLGEEFEYSLNNETYQSSPDFTNLSEGNYVLTVKNKYTTCEIEYPNNPFTLTNLELSGTVTDIICNPETTGAIDITVSGGAPPYSYSWSNGETTEDLTNIAAGTYTVTITDTNDCPVSQQFTINQPTSQLSSTITKTDVSCKGDSTGAIDLTINGGTAPYSVLWNTNSTNQDLSGLPAGTYEVTITDASGCVSTQTVDIIEPSSGVNGNIENVENIDCFGNNNGSITVEASGGVSPYIYSIDGGNNNQNSPTFQNLEAGNYTITITDANGCTTTIQCGITEPNELTINIENVVDVSCASEPTGAIDLAVSGGTEPYTYQWSNNATTQDLNNIAAGSYSVTVTDANGCTAIKQAVVSEPNETVTGSISQLVDVGCNGENTGSLTVDASGGISPYLFSIDNGSNNQSNGFFENLAAGDYTILITDANGCFFNFNATINTVDNSDPEINVPTSISIEGCNVNDIDATSAVFAYSNSQSNDIQTIFESNSEYNASDDSSIESITYIDTITSIDNCPITVSRTFTITDNCGNTASTVQTITIQDTTAPSLSIPADITIECSEDESSTNTGVATGSDTCGSVTISQNDSETAACGNTKTIVRTWTATDNCGNSISDTQTITVIDTTAPTFTVPEDITIECDVDATDLSITGDVTDEADNCDTDLEATFTDSITNGSCANQSTITRTWSLTDACDNTATFVQTINLIDTTVPTFTVPEDITIECDVDATDLSITGDVTDEADNCDTDLEATFTDSIANGSCANQSTITRTWSLTDACGNTASLVQTINIVDTIAPVISIQASNIIIECDENMNNGEIQDWLDNNGGAVASDACGDVTWSNNYDGTISDCSNAIQVIFTATDVCGNTTNTSATYSIQDTNAPNISTQASNLTVECDGSGNLTELNDWLANNAGAIASDDCSALIWSNDFTELTDDCGSTGSATITFTATDACGNSQTTTAVFSIEDTSAPTFNDSLPIDVDVDCDMVPEVQTLTASDNCGDANVTFGETTTPGTCDNTYTLTRIWTATDTCGNETVHIQTIKVKDISDPTFNESLPADMDVECDAVPIAETLTASDNCGDASVEFGETTTAGTCDNTYTLTRTWTATDSCGNETVHIQTINVTDTTAPTFNESLPADMDVECDAVPTAETLTASDNCGDASVEFGETTTAGTCDNTYTLTRTWTATDSCGNETVHIQTINVTDTTAPTFNESLPADMDVECDAVPTAETLTASDNCGDASVEFGETTTAGTCDNTYTLTRTWTATDSCGNETVHIQTINVTDTTAPTFNESLPADMDVECDAVPTAETLTADDNCGDASVEFGETTTAGTCDNTYILTRTWTATDGCGNETVHIQTINVTDTTAPTFNESLPADMDVECDAVPTAETLTADDNCGDANVTFGETTTAGTCDNTYILTRTWTATDSCGNETVHIQTINVTDTTAPTFNESLPTDMDVECDAVPTAETLTASDNCGDASVEFEEEITNGACMGDFIIVRTWTAVDTCGNETVHTQIITVQDTTAPTLVSPFDETVNVSCDEIPEVPELVFEDACSNDIEVTFNEDSTQANDFEDYSIIRTWNVVDDCGNEATFTQTIMVELSNVMNAFDASRCVLDSEFDLFDLLSGDFNMNGTWSVVSGNATLNGSFFDPSSVEVGVYTFMYSITEGPCPKEVEVNVTIDDDCVVLACGKDDVIISKTVTANGDTYNEFFTITGIEECGFVIELQIFNRWGAKIYESKNYQNNWNGNAHGSSVGNSGKVPTGTYYYVINLRNSGLEPFAGPIYVATK